MGEVLHDSRDYVARARSLGPVLAARRTRSSETANCRHIVSALIDNRLFRLLQPRSFGGAELDPVTYVQVVEQIASHDASTAWCVEQANGCSMAAAFLDPEVAQEIFGPPDGIVAWGPVGPAELRAVPGGFRLTGAWNFASGSHHASWLGAHVVTPGPDGAPLSRADGGEILRTLLFPKSQATMTDIWHVVGLRGTGSDRYSVSDLFIPERYTALRNPEIAPRQPGRLYCFSSSSLYACGVAAVALGIARGMVADFTELATEKVPRGARQRLCENQVIQSQRAQAEARLGSARASSERSRRDLGSGRRDRRAEPGAKHDDPPRFDLGHRPGSRGRQHPLSQRGATAIFDDRPFERRFRDMHTASQQAQGRQAHYETIGRIPFRSCAGYGDVHFLT